MDTPIETIQQGVYNAYVMFEGGETATDKSLGCTYEWSRVGGNTDVCNTGYCIYSDNCASDCCDYYNRCWDCDDAADLAWLWWTLSFFFLFLCIISIVAGAKRRQRQA